MAKILVIDDDPRIAELLLQILKSEKHDVIKALDGCEAEKKFKEFKPEIVITDIVMPEKEGTELIMLFKKMVPGIKIIAISGGGIIGPKSYLEVAKKIGANYTFTKPFNIDDIIKAINDLSKN